MLVAKPDDPSSVPGTRMVTGRTASPANGPLTSTCAVWPVCAHRDRTFRCTKEGGREEKSS